MKINYKATALFGLVGFMGIGIEVSTLSAQEKFEEALQPYNTSIVKERLTQAKTDSAADLRLINQMNAHAALQFYCHPDISKKINGYMSADGHELVQKAGDNYKIWQAETQNYAIWQNVYSTIEPGSKMQICATLDEDNDFVLHLGGTNFTNANDMSAAYSLARGKVGPRAAASLEQTEIAVEELKERNPDLDLSTVHASIVAHSAGGSAVPGAMAVLAKHGFDLNKTVILDPFGAEASFEAAENVLGFTAGEMRHNVTTIKPGKNGLLDHFKRATKSVGKKEICDAAGHLGKYFIDTFDKKRVKAAQKTP